MKRIRRIFLWIFILFLAVLVLAAVRRADWERDHKVVYKDNGFYPNMIIVAKGDRVKFVNATDRAVWPASDPHPTHDRYGAFDPKEPILPGKTWVMTFDTPGQWNYHNHLGSNYSQDTGLVIVLAKGQANIRVTDEASREYCMSIPAKERFPCWRERLSTITKTRGAKAALEELSALYAIDEEASSGCNNLTHAIGGASVEKTPKATTWTDDTLFCGAGFYHGFMEVYLSRYKNVSQARVLCETLPQRLEARGQEARLACYHGVGHGITEMNGIHTITRWEDFVPTLLIESTKRCRQLSDDVGTYESCYNGVYNSFHLHYALGFRESARDTKDPLWMCRDIPHDNGAGNCYHDMAIFLFERTDVQRALHEIVNTVDAQYQEQAVFGVMNSYIFSRVWERSYVAYRDICRTVHGGLRNACFEAIVRGLVNNGQPRKEEEFALEFCRSQLSFEEKKKCYQTLGSARGGMAQDAALRVCAGAEESFRADCIGQNTQ